MSDTSINTAALQQILTGTEPGPAGLFDLVVRHHTDPDAAEVLCAYATGSFPLLTAVFAGTKHAVWGRHTWATTYKDAPGGREFDKQVSSLVYPQFEHAAEADLLESLRTVRSAELLDRGPGVPLRLTHMIVMYAPFDALTDRVTAEMSWMSMKGLCPELGAGPPGSAAEPPNDAGAGRICWLLARYLYNRFGDHVPSWDMFKKQCEPPGSVADAADLAVTAQHTYQL